MIENPEVSRKLPMIDSSTVLKDANGVFKEIDGGAAGFRQRRTAARRAGRAGAVPIRTAVRRFLMPTLGVWLIALVSPLLAQPPAHFEVAVVKRYNHDLDFQTAYGPQPSFGCHIGPGKTQYTCAGTVARLMAEALNLSDFQFDVGRSPEYVIFGKMSAPATRQQMDQALLVFLRERLGVQYHLTKRPLNAEFIAIADSKKLPISQAPLPVADAYAGRPQFFGREMRRFEAFCRQRSTEYSGEEFITCSNISLNLLAQHLYRYTGLPTVDASGSTQRLDVTFVLKRDLNAPPSLALVPVTNLPELRKTLASYGIGLQHRSGVVDFLIIDRVAPETVFLNQ
jgi:uncharacterized protein (TIGR03435 family)